MTTRCELINTYEVLEHVMGIKGLHPHRLDTIKEMRAKLVRYVCNHPAFKKSVVLDIGCGNGIGTYELALMFDNSQRVIGIDINSRAIENARKAYPDQHNLSFYHGELKGFLRNNPNLRISAVICISVSMFITDVKEFYQLIYRSLLDCGMFIDAPFMFRNMQRPASEEFHRQTYAVCGCNMKMYESDQLRGLFHDAGFSNVACANHDFDLMKLPVLFADYRPHYLIGNFFKNVISPPAHFGGISSRYLFSRTLKIFIFFLKNRHRYASGEFVSVKIAN